VISFDVKGLAKDLVMGTKLELAAREELVARMIEVAVEIVNEPHRKREILDPLIEIMLSSYDMIQPDQLMLRYAEHIKERSRELGWDSRLLVKLEFKKIGGNFHRALVNMDFEGTIRKFKPVARPRKQKEKIVDTVSDHPDQDTLNEYLNAVTTRPERRIPLLSDRLGTRIKDA